MSRFPKGAIDASEGRTQIAAVFKVAHYPPSPLRYRGGANCRNQRLFTLPKFYLMQQACLVMRKSKVLNNFAGLDPTMELLCTGRFQK